MKRRSPLAAAFAVTMALSPVVAYQALAQSHSAIVATDHSMRSSKLIGMTVYDKQGLEIGKIEDIMVPKDAGSAPLAVLSVDGSRKTVGVPLSRIAIKDDKASMNASKAEVADLPYWKFESLEGGGG
jgi:sporulation protein YlmC with PRC-barrel domain